MPPGGLADLPGVLLLGGGQLELGHGQTPSGMVGQAEAAKSSLEDITIVTKAQYNETGAAQAVGCGTRTMVITGQARLSLSSHRRTEVGE